ncbi:MAG: hypothetical protein MUF52_12605 [Syntrophobacteraceae bacterium]|jgi:hypothetical protein|nr:hypothetical protein [Syntrophobacteraceae bacterium]MCU0588978.1 hypothetical protein [Syntrophobacteraceae bacterium]
MKASDKDRKRKAKRERKIKERREEEHRQLRLEKSQEYLYLAVNAFRRDDYRIALDHILKYLKILPADVKGLNFALDCA